MTRITNIAVNFDSNSAIDDQYDIFISYKRHRAWTAWTRNHLRDLLVAYLSQELGWTPEIFVDERIEPGADWPHRLGDSLARARILLTVFSRDDFASAWCVHELDLMHGRLLRSPESTLIVPVVGHDGDLIPDEVGRIQPHDLMALRNPDILRRTERYELFADAVARLAPHVANAILSAPPFDPTWVRECRDRFDLVTKARCRSQMVNVQTLTLKPLPRPIMPPRIAP